MDIASIPLSLYVHIPWCVRKCPYCDFNSHEVSSSSGRKDQLVDEETERAYLARLLEDFSQEISHYAFYQAGNSKRLLSGAKPRLHSVFIGGGTPSLLSPDFYQQLFDGVAEIADLDSVQEITMEMNPGTSESYDLRGYRQVGINRLSMGVQSFDDRHLQKLGRIHSADNARAAFLKARDSGFNNINIDLMHGLPEQSPEQAQSDINEAIDLEPEHISWYQLTIERNTEFFSRPPTLPAEECLSTIADEGDALLARANYVNYEVSAYARAGYQSLHNMNYWQFGDYLGIGAGAHGKISSADGVLRRWKTRVPKDYISSINLLAGERQISSDELPQEYLMNVLRLSTGFTPDQFQDRTGLSYELIRPVVDNLCERELLQKQRDRISTTAVGCRFLDSVLAEF